jgi:spore germination cell wall hydrolase CwlJ-like protein
MVASLVRRAPFAARAGLGLALLFASTSQAAYQDLASLLVNQPGVAERARSFLLSNPFAALKTATLSLPRPIGVAIPQLPMPASLDVTGSIPPFAAFDRDGERDEPAQVFNRAAKGDRLTPAPAAVAHAAEAPETNPVAGETAALAATDPAPAVPRADDAGTIARTVEPVPAAGALGKITRLFFGASDDELPPLLFEHRAAPEPKVRLASLPNPARPAAGATTVAPKGLVTGEEGQPKSPAERLGIVGATRVKAEKCLADAVYFESRGEPERGQIAVAQVVINRVFSGFYPEDVCGTVYQNAHRYLACQFTFACEGKKLVVDEPDAWARATWIAREMLDGKLWLAEVGKATHYHAYWVKPDWIREMRKIDRIGVHTFYRPRAWEG